MKQRTPWIAAALVAGALTACGGSSGPLTPDGPDLTSVAGEYRAGSDYTALTFQTDDGAAEVNWLDHGASLVLDLAADGTVSGELYIPVPDDPALQQYFEQDDIDRGHIREDMAGTWTLSGSTVRFQQDADTFVRDMAFTYNEGTLTAEETFSSLRVLVVLSKT